jgi:hypothetical protein
MTSMMQLLEEKLDRGLRDVRFELAETRLKVEATEHQIAKLEKEATGSGATTVKAAIEKAEEQRKAQETQLATVREAIDQQRLEQQTQHDKLSQQVAANRAAIDVLTMEMAAQAASAAKSIEHDVAELRQRVDEQEANMANQWREMARQMIDGDQYVKKNDLLSLSDEMVQLQRVVSHSHEQVCNRRTHRPTPCGRHRRVPLVCPVGCAAPPLRVAFRWTGRLAKSTFGWLPWDIRSSGCASPSASRRTNWQRRLLTWMISTASS